MTDSPANRIPPRSAPSIGTLLVYGLAALVALVALSQLIALARAPQQPDEAMLAATGTVIPPTRTNTPTDLPTPTFTNTFTPTPTPTPLPSATPLPTSTPTPAPTSTATPLPPPPATPEPSPTPLPPTETPVSLSVLDRIEIDNGSWGTRELVIRYESDAASGEQFYVTGTDGRRYRASMGFLSSPEAAAAIQEQWSKAGRGSANWGMVVLVRKQITDWYLCPTTSGVCYISQIDAGQAVIFTDIYLRDVVWKSLLNDYLAGGILRTTTNPYYKEIIKAVFAPVIEPVPATPCIGFSFERAN